MLYRAKIFDPSVIAVCIPLCCKTTCLLLVVVYQEFYIFMSFTHTVKVTLRDVTSLLGWSYHEL